MLSEQKNKYPIYEVIRYLPPSIGNVLSKLPLNILIKIEEIRLRQNRPLIISGCSNEYFISNEGKLASNIDNPYIVSVDDIKSAVQLVCNFSLYSVEDELRNGYITIIGGHRVGVCGKAVIENGKIKTMKDISFLNYRIAKQILGAADKVLEHVICPLESIYNTLIISPPQCGKTTLLRDLVRQLSNGIPMHKFNGKKIGLIDERNEIAACSQGIPRNDVGIRTDVLDSCSKAEGIILMIRSMSPEIIATDEIGKHEDGEAILDAVNAGVKVITTIHGSDIKDFMNKPSLTKLQDNIFERIIVMSKRKGVGTVESILDRDFKEVFS